MNMLICVPIAFSIYKQPEADHGDKKFLDILATLFCFFPESLSHPPPLRLPYDP